MNKIDQNCNGIQESSTNFSGALKQTVIPSPIIKNIFHINISRSKKYEGLTSEIYESDGNFFEERFWRETIGKESQASLDTQDLLFDDDDNFFVTEEKLKQDEDNSSKNSKKFLETVLVLVKETSISINGFETRLPASVRSACLIPGVRLDNDKVTEEESESYDEDSLLINLNSGVLLLLRIYVTEQSNFKPFTVQWWNLNHTDHKAKLDDVGKDILAHSSGLSIVLTSALDKFRIHNCKYTNHGLLLDNPFNVKVNGTILDSCFLDSLDAVIESGHVMFLTLIITKERRLELHLFEWFSGEAIHARLQEYVLPLPNTFEIPIFTTSLKGIDGFAFFTETKLSIITVHQIMSAEYNFNIIPTTISFPTSYYKPNTLIRNTHIDGSPRHAKDAEILVATEKGVIYSFLITSNNEVSYKQLLRVPGVPSTFSMEKLTTDIKYNKCEYQLIYADIEGMGKNIVVTDLIPDDVPRKPESKIKGISEFITIDDYENWAPLLDYTVIKSSRSKNINSHSDEEVWSLSGSGKRTSLVHLRYGVKASKLLRDPSFKGALKVFEYHDSQYIYFVYSFLTKTLVIKHSLNDNLRESKNIIGVVEDAKIDLTSRTLALSTLPDVQAILQITETSIIISNIKDLFTRVDFEDEILLCDVLEDTFVYVTETSQIDFEGCFVQQPLLKLELCGIKTSELSSRDSQKILIRLIEPILLDYEPSSIKLIHYKSSLYVIIGSYDNSILIYKYVDGGLMEHVKYEFMEELKGKLVNDMAHVFFNHSDSLYVGSRDGYLVEIELRLTGQFLDPIQKRFIKISDTQVEFIKTGKSHNLFLLSRNLWSLNLSISNFPQKVMFKETTDMASHSAVQVPTSNSIMKLALLRDDGFIISNVNSNPSCCPKTIRLGESAKKFTYLSHITSFAVISHSEDCLSRLKFIDQRKSRKIDYKQIKAADNSEIQGPFFSVDEMPLSLSQWSVKKNESRSYRQLVVGSQSSSGGSIKIFDIVKGSNADFLSVSLLNSWKTEGPVYTVLQLANNSLIYSSGNTLQISEYNLETKRMNPVQSVYEFQSLVCSLSVQGKDICVSTFSDSIYHFVFDDKGTLVLSHRDTVSRHLLNEAFASNSIAISDKLHSSVCGLNISSEDKNLRSFFKSYLSFIPRLHGCSLSSIWINDVFRDIIAGRRVLACGVNGELSCFTFLQDDEFKKMQSLTQSLYNINYSLSSKITGKGFYDLSQFQWSLNYWDFNVIDGDCLMSKHQIPESVGSYINSISL